MAVISMRPGQQETAWSQLMKKYPTIDLCLQAIGELIGYVINGHLLVDLGRWVVLTSGRIAETALLFATLWVTASSVAPDFVDKLPNGLPGTFTNLSLMALTLLPEVVLYAAIVTSYIHWRNCIEDQDHRVEHGVWAVMYTIPTLTFLGMTIFTICTFVDVGHTVKATSDILTIRCLAGWGYGLVGLIHAAISRKSPVKSGTESLISVSRNVPTNFVPTPTFQAQIAEQVAEQSGEQRTEQARERNTDAIPVIVPQDDQKSEEEAELVAEVGRNTGGTRGQSSTGPANSSVIDIKNRRKSLSSEEVAQVLACSPRYVRTLRAQNKLEKDEADETLTTAQSVRDYMATRNK